MIPFLRRRPAPEQDAPDRRPGEAAPGRGHPVRSGAESGAPDTREVLRFRWDSDATVRSGASAADVSAVLRPILATRFPSFFADIEQESRLPVRMVVAGADETDVAALVEQPLLARDSTYLQLATLAPFAVETVPGAIERFDQQYRRYVSIDYRGPYRMGNEFIQQQLEGFAVPTGYRLERSTFGFFTEETTRTAGWVLLATIGLVFLITAAVFESWRLPALVMLSVPLAGVGVAVGFLWSGANFAEGAFIGTVLLIGVSVNDSILLTDRYRQLRRLRPGTSRKLLIRLSVRERLRPMWTTTLTTTASLLPLIVFPSAGEFWLGLAVTVTGGLLAATLLAPFATVAMVGIGRR